MALFDFNTGSISGSNRTLDTSLGDNVMSWTESGFTFTLTVTGTSGNGFLFASVGGGELGLVVHVSPPTSQMTASGNFFQAVARLTVKSGANLLPITAPVLQYQFANGVTHANMQYTGGTKFVGTSANAVSLPDAYGFLDFVIGGPSTGSMSILSLSLPQLTCFLTGTRIATPAGEVPVESLQPGDRVLRADGGVTTVKWVGRQTVDVRLSHPAKVNPIRIEAGALGDNVPCRDLFVTADHALCIDGVLVNAGALVNGTTITRVPQMPMENFTYWHVETEAHEVILAENTPVESFMDYAGRDSFDNAGDYAGDEKPMPEMALPRVSAARLVPEAIRARIAERALNAELPMAA